MLFQTYSRATGQLTGAPLPQANAYARGDVERRMPDYLATENARSANILLA